MLSESLNIFLPSCDRDPTKHVAYVTSCFLKPLFGDTIPRFDWANSMDPIAVMPCVAMRYAHTIVALRLTPWKQWTLQELSAEVMEQRRQFVAYQYFITLILVQCRLDKIRGGFKMGGYVLTINVLHRDVHSVRLWYATAVDVSNHSYRLNTLPWKICLTLQDCDNMCDTQSFHFFLVAGST